ncbi:MAG: S41 family peptidase [candidate division Zixibacteria bacterium]|nr:S41 family peptidase [candidate division Zixibacteria bacterium]
MTSGRIDIASTEAPVSEEHCSQPAPSYVTIRGILWLVIICALVFASVRWLRSDPRQRAVLALTSASRLIFDSGVVPVDPAILIQAGADGLLSVLDPYSSYLSPEEYDSFLEDTEGEYVGIGIEIATRDGETVIYHVFPQSPAAEAFLRPGDHIISVNGQSVAGLRGSQVVQVMAGPSDTPLTLTVERPGGSRRTMTLTRRKVDVDVFPIVGITQSGVAYVRWTEFTDGSGDRLAAIIEDLLVDRPIGLVLDLRENPGGILDEAVTAAGIFLPTGFPVCELVGRSPSASGKFVTGLAPSTYQGPVILLQDETTASASEVFIAALHDAGRALVVGRKSFGKGWVQTISPLEGMGALRLSTARYSTPSGHFVGDPRASRQQYDSILAGYEPAGAGLPADLAVPASKVGAWEVSCLQAGVFADYVAVNSDDWPAAGVEDSAMLLEGLRHFCDSANIHPAGPVQQLIDRLSGNADTLLQSPRKDEARELLKGAARTDAELLFNRERRRFLRRLWEERLMTVSDIDPGELEALMEFDQDLAVARDLIEEPERYRLMLESSQAKHVSASEVP